MRRNISLYIADTLADINEDTLLQFTYTTDELTNPTIVRSSYSQSVTLPATAQNNRIFGSFARNDRRTASGFSALDRTAFQLINDKGELLESGYLRLDEIERKGRDIHSYKVTLYGGLGDMFYRLSYDSDGDQMDLAALTYTNEGGTTYHRNSNIIFTRDGVKSAWESLDTPSESEPYDIVNFAPAYEGTPEDFDANKALIVPNIYEDCPATFQNDTYKPADAGNRYVITFGSTKNNWETLEMRTYLLRPVLRVKAVVLAIKAYAQTLGYNIVLGSEFFSADNPYYNDSWLTLNRIKTGKRSQQYDTLGSLLEDTCTPAAFLIGLAKMYGLYFHTEGNQVSILTRNEFYNSAGTIDLTERINLEGLVAAPLFADTRYYSLAVAGVGEFAKAVKEQTAREYGDQRIDTGYPFEVAAKELLADMPFKTCATACEFSADYVRGYVYNASTTPQKLLLPMSRHEDVTARVALVSDTSNEADIALPFKKGTAVYDNASVNGCAWNWLPQLHDAENKDSSDGAGVLLLYNGKEQAAVVSNLAKTYTITGYDATRVSINGGKDCWDMRAGTIGADYVISAIPAFKRDNATCNSPTATASLDFGLPRSKQYPYATIQSTAPVYARCWQSFCRDRYNKDTRVLRAKVSLAGLQLGQGLLRKFWWYDNALWVLNSISNVDVTSWEDAECEFIKVQSREAYQHGQNYTATTAAYTSASPASLVWQEAGAKTISIASNESWGISGVPSWLTASVNSGSGSASVRLTASSFTAGQSASIVVRGASGQQSTIAVSTQARPVTTKKIEIYNLYGGRVSFASWQGGDTSAQTYRVVLTGISAVTLYNGSSAHFTATLSGDTLTITPNSTNTSGSSYESSITLMETGGTTSEVMGLSQSSTQATYTLSTDLEDATIPANGGIYPQLYASTDCASDVISLVSDSAWVELSLRDTNPLDIEYYVQTNPWSTNRTAVLTLSTSVSGITRRYYINQQASATTYVLETDLEDINASADALGRGCQAWTNYEGDELSVESSASWISVAADGTNPIDFDVDLLENTTGATRNGTITIRAAYSGLSATFNVSQAARVEGYALEVSALQQFSAAGGTQTLSVVGVHTIDGVSTRTALSASDLTITGSLTAFTRSGLSLTAANLGSTQKARTSESIGITWTAHPAATATATAVQQANVVEGVTPHYAYDNYRVDTFAATSWQSGGEMASNEGDRMTPTIVAYRNRRTTNTTSYTSGAIVTTDGGTVTEPWTGYTLAADGVGITIEGTTLVWAANPWATTRTATAKVMNGATALATLTITQMRSLAEYEMAFVNYNITDISTGTPLVITSPATYVGDSVITMNWRSNMNVAECLLKLTAYQQNDNIYREVSMDAATAGNYELQVFGWDEEWCTAGALRLTATIKYKRSADDEYTIKYWEYDTHEFGNGGYFTPWDLEEN